MTNSWRRSFVAAHHKQDATSNTQRSVFASLPNKPQSAPSFAAYRTFPSFVYINLLMASNLTLIMDFLIQKSSIHYYNRSFVTPQFPKNFYRTLFVSLQPIRLSEWCVTDLPGPDLTRAQLNGAGTKRVADFTALECSVDFSLSSLRIVVLR
jgi:hypothetical protein